jgi:glycosyltransferase involved in cell wall biosynthesis
VARPSLRVAFVVTHPIQYYAPLYQRLARRDDIAIKVFFTWHADRGPVADHGFGIPVAWDMPLTDGYDFETVANTSREPGTHHFRGVRNPGLVHRIVEWRPDVVHITGWAWQSHVGAMRALAKRKIATLFRGDSHLLDERRQGPRWRLKQEILRRIYSWPTGFLVTGTANRGYYAAFGVGADRLHPCPHSIDVARFAGPPNLLDREAAEWRRSLGIGPEKTVLLFAGKFEPRKCPIELMREVAGCARPGVVLILVGDGILKGEIERAAAADPARFRVLPFQNQSRMPIVYRLGDLFVLPSSYGETWGLAANEALACGRPVLLSDRVGCAQDAVDDSCGRVFSWADPLSLTRALASLLADAGGLAAMGRAAAQRAWAFDIGETERGLMAAVAKVCAA